mmetsp:Transcript_1422/g.4304  ORF Transcript_1422/g.4304 Transcript_1422/m.4304 type:complete len:1452 (+) Transcript_1422:2-4357(+)
MIEEKRDEKEIAYRRLQTGVDKIDDANNTVVTLQEELVKLAPFIAQKIKEADELVPVVTEEQKKAEVIKEKVSGEELIVRKQADEVRVIQEDAQRDLDVAMPMLKNALKSLDQLDKKDITEIKSFAKPPSLVMMTMQAVNLLLGEKQDWDAAKRVLSGNDFMDRLKNFDKDNIPQKVLKKLGEDFVQKPEYAPDTVGNQSKAAKSLCMWTHAMDTYSKVAKEVEPKRQAVAELNRKLAVANGALKEKQDSLRKVEEEVAALKKRLKDTNDEKERFESEAALTKARLQRADILTLGLADEGVRWRETVASIKQEITNLTGDVFLSSAAISYYGPFTGVYRNEIVDAWLKSAKDLGIPCGDSFDLRHTMGNPVEIRDWNLQGLPADAVSINNGMLVVRGKRWPLMIDPQAQGNKWIKKKEGKELKAIKMSNPKMLLILEGCIRTGAPLLMEDVEETLDPALEPVLLKAFFENNGRLQIKLGDSDVDYDKAFNFYMTTKMPNPHYFPEVCIKVTVINFTVTFDGLEEQLLNEAVSKEIPETLQRRTELMLQLADDKKVLKQLEDKILKLLSESSGNILDDEVLINTLAESKETSKAVNVRVKEAEEAAVEIDAACKEYTQVATCGSITYFVIADLANINPMYQFSLFYFARLFNKCIDMAEKSDEIDMRLQMLQASIMSNIFLNICRGLFEDDKLTFSLILATSFQRHMKEINPAEWSLLLRGMGLLDTSQKPKNPDPEFFSEKMWEFVYAIQCCSVEHCSGLCEHIIQHTDDWKDWVGADDPHKLPLPLYFDEENELHYFQIVLLLKALAPEKLIFALQEHVRRSLGEHFIIFPTATVQELYDDSSKSTPIVFVLSTGADPTSMLLRFAGEKGMLDSLGVISLGQGQGPKAIKMVDEACKAGTWVLLQNCHLAPSFMPKLETIVEKFIPEEMSPDFRLWLTACPSPAFPISILQMGVKMTIEPPKGLKQALLRSYMGIDEEWFEGCTKPFEFKKMLFGLCFFHGLILERRGFGPVGWNVMYGFSEPDRDISRQQLRNFLDEFEGVPYAALNYMVAEANYGGRVTDDNDRKCLLAILERYVTPSILKEDYKFSESGNYRCPVDSNGMTVEGWRDYVKAWPLAEQPEVFGMHDNANISYMSQESEKVLNVVLSIQPREGGGGGGKSSEETVLDLAREQEERLPVKLSDENAHPSSFAIVEETKLMISLGTCLTQEYGRFNKLLSQVTSTLAQMQKAIKGIIVMTGELDDMYNAMLNNQVPNIWTKGGIGYPSLKPLSSWFEDMILRFDFFRDWIDNGEPDAFWISSFYFPQGFLTSVLQGYSRKEMIPVDQLSYEFNIQPTDDPEELDGAPAEGIFVHGLFMDGMAWDYEEMVIADQDFGVMFVKCPVINFIPWQDKITSKDKYSCPLYKTSVRAGTLSTTGHSTNYVLSIEMESVEERSYWILKGAALLTMLND